MENKTVSIADELLKLNQLKEKGIISEGEFIQTKNMLLKKDEKNINTEENKNDTYVKKTFLNTFPKYLFKAVIGLIILTLVNVLICVSNPTVKYYYDNNNCIIKDKGYSMSDALLSAKVKSKNYNLTIDDLRIQEISLLDSDSSFWNFQQVIFLLVFGMLFIIYPLHRLFYGESVYKY